MLITERVLLMNNIYKKINNKEENVDINEAFNLVMRNASQFNSLPDQLRKSPEFLSNVLYHYPSFFEDTNINIINKDTELLKNIITAPIPSLENRPFEALSLAHPKIKTREFCLEMISINPYNIRHVPHHFLYDSEFIELALQGDGATVQFMPSFVKINEDFGLMAVKSNGFSLKYFANNVINSREVLLSALDTKGFSLSHFNNPEEMCYDMEIAEKALKADPKAMKFFTKDNPLVKDKYFAIKMIPVNAKFFSLFDEEIRHDPDTLLQIVKGKSVEQILYIVSQEFMLYPKFFLFALDAYQKCLTEEEKQENYGFYYYLHTALFKERQKKFNIAYRRNLERKKMLSKQEEQKEAELRLNAQTYLKENDPEELVIIENETLPQVLKKEAKSVVDNHQDNVGRLGKKYKIQSSKDFSGTISPTTDDDDFSHLANLADTLHIDENITQDNIDISITELDNDNSFVEPTKDEGITASSFVDYQCYTSEKVKKVNNELNEIYVPAIELPKNKTIVPDVTRYQDPIVEMENSINNEANLQSNKIEPTFEEDFGDISPAKSAAMRAFGDRGRNTIAPIVRDENDYIHKPIKRETTKKGSLSIFNFNKDK